MKLSTLLNLTNTTLYFPTEQNIDFEVSGLHYDSRLCKEGYLFFATDGTHTDGHNFIESAIANGAKAVVFSKELENYHDNVAYIKVDSPRYSMSSFCSAFYEFPQKSMKVIGVTGTDGKSSTVALISNLLELCGKKAGYLSTVSYKAGSTVYDNPYRQSTPEPVELYSILSQMKNEGSEFAVIEATSHGLSPINNRLGDISFDAAIFTNVTSEHLEFHKTLEQYRKDKTNLFKLLKKSGIGIVNGNDPYYTLFTSATEAKTFAYFTQKTNESLQNCNASDSVFISNINCTPTGSTFTITLEGEDYDVKINLPGEFNIENATASFLTVYNLLKDEYSDKKLFARNLGQKLQKLSSIKGRMNVIENDLGINLIVDYAHTPGAFEKLFPAMRKYTTGKLIALFGSGGERDRIKRSVQGEIADNYCDAIFLTDEDPRLEDSVFIIEEIAQGCKKNEAQNTLFKIPNRNEAIKAAIDFANAGDTILFLGKGHESCIIYSDGRHPWNEAEAVREAAHRKGLGTRG